ncbi:MAG: hypothetical protein ABI981_04160 [Betaproteobacteria bacterium]
MKPLRKRPHLPADDIGGPLVWTFEGAFATCLADMEDALRRAIVQVGDVSSIVVQIELSLPALKRRIDVGDTIQPVWGRFLDELSERYGLPSEARVRALDREGPLATLVIAYRT